MISLNSLKLNPGKFQFMRMGANTDINGNTFLDENKIKKSQEAVLFQIAMVISKVLKSILKKFVEQQNANYTRCNTYKNY